MKNLSCYSASKAAALALTQVAALEYGSYGVRCNVICPGFVDTPINAAVPKEMLEASAASIPLGRIGTPRDIANLELYLAADENNWTTGHAFVPDGGATIA